MVFSSISFLIYFLPITICVYYIVPKAVKNIVLFVASLIFYGWGEPVYIFLMLFSIAFNYISGTVLEAVGRQKEHSRKHKTVLIINIAGNLALLGFFKYADFLINNINLVFNTSFSESNLPLPIGISFYTFQAMSYIIDLYKGKVKVQKNIVAFGTYVALFPQLIAGPIVRFKDIENQLVSRTFTFELFASGVKRFIIGMSKKVLLANNIGILWVNISSGDLGQLSAASAWLGAFAFTMQIYFDFSGYSDMAIGLGKMFGFNFPENFKYPYTSKSITEFWSRWHISLSSWFKEYVYIPLGGNRKGIQRQIINIAIVWILTGLWHGASWNFVLWGVYFAVILIMEKIFMGQILKRLNDYGGFLGRAAVHVYTMLLVTVSWVIFALENMNQIGAYILSMSGLGKGGIIDGSSLYMVSGNLLLIILCVLGAGTVPAALWNKIRSRIDDRLPMTEVFAENVGLLLLLLLNIAYIVSSTYNPFLYFRF